MTACSRTIVCTISCVVYALAGANTLNAQVLFQDDFDRANLASPMWQTLGSAYITADPLSQGHGGVLAFRSLGSGGDLGA